MQKHQPEIDITKDMILYHGSKGGIDGKIEPCSRVRCDFGRGFYMGTDLMQAKSIVSDDDMPYYYKLRFRISEIPKDRIMILDEKYWLRTVLACRKADREFDSLQIAKKVLKKLEHCDVVVGLVADGIMGEAMVSFIDNVLTDKGLFHCMTYVSYCLQVVAKTHEACKCIDILEEHPLKGQELQEAEKYADEKRMEFRNVVNNAKIGFDGMGHTFFSIIRNEIRAEKEKTQDVGGI